MDNLAKQFKWVLLAGIIVAAIVCTIAANFDIVQLITYKFENNNEGIIKILDTRGAKSQNDWFYIEGVDFLLDQDELDEATIAFLSSNFINMNDDVREKVIKKYNTEKLYFDLNKDFVDIIFSNINNDNYKAYLRRLDEADMDNALMYRYGANPTIDNTLINNLISVLDVYNGDLKFDKFKFDVYTLLNFEDDKYETEKIAILKRIPTQVARASIFAQLKTKEIKENELATLVKFLHDAEIVTDEEHVSFNSIYADVKLLRKEYAEIDDKVADLETELENIEALIGDKQTQVDDKQSQLDTLEKEIADLETEIDNKSNYMYMTLYIEQLSGTGRNEYIASIPRNGLFGLRPTSRKYIIKLNDNVKIGSVMDVNIYYKGMKDFSGKSYEYYEEVSKADEGDITKLQQDRTDKLKQAQDIKNEIQDMQSDIDAIKQENNYDDVKSSLDEIDNEREEIQENFDSKVSKIAELFGLQSLQMEL